MMEEVVTTVRELTLARPALLSCVVVRGFRRGYAMGVGLGAWSFGWNPRALADWLAATGAAYVGLILLVAAVELVRELERTK